MEYNWYKNGRLVIKSEDMEKVWVFEMTQEYFDEYIGNQTHHKGNLYIPHSTGVTSLGMLEHVDGDLMVDDDHTSLRSLSNLEFVKGELDLSYSKVASLGNLKHVGLDLDLRGTNITDLGKLEHVGGDIYCSTGTTTDELFVNSKFSDKIL